MKTNFKHIKTIVAIFLALSITSCQDELIEQQDLSNTNQELSKKTVEYWGRFIAGSSTGSNTLESLAPAGNSSSNKFTIQWPYCTGGGACDKVFDLTVTGVDSETDYHPNYRVQISLNKKAGKITSFQMWLHDGNYHFATEKTNITTPIDFPATTHNVVIQINTEVELFRYLNRGNKKRESVGSINIGALEYCRKDQSCDGWL